MHISAYLIGHWPDSNWTRIKFVRTDQCNRKLNQSVLRQRWLSAGRQSWQTDCSAKSQELIGLAVPHKTEAKKCQCTNHLPGSRKCHSSWHPTGRWTDSQLDLLLPNDHPNWWRRPCFPHQQCNNLELGWAGRSPADLRCQWLFYTSDLGRMSTDIGLCRTYRQSIKSHYSKMVDRHVGAVVR